MKYHKILHPTNYSEDSRPALLTAASFAHEHGAKLVLLHVVDTLGPEKVSFGEMSSQPQPDAYRQRLWDELHQVRPADPHVHVEYVLSEEQLVTAILRTASELNCDLIVMGTHGTTGWRHWLAGSVAEAIVWQADCSVLVVKPPRRSEPLPPLDASPGHPGRLIEVDPEVTT